MGCDKSRPKSGSKCESFSARQSMQGSIRATGVAHVGYGWAETLYPGSEMPHAAAFKNSLKWDPIRWFRLDPYNVGFGQYVKFLFLSNSSLWSNMLLTSVKSYPAHHSASFLSWHRYFIHTYENTIKIECGYPGVLPWVGHTIKVKWLNWSLTFLKFRYWDWSLDWENLAGSPVWSPETGFGGDGLVDGEEGVGEGRCVTDGPFAGHTNLFYGAKNRPHCLSRGFTDGHGHNGSISGDGVHPEQLEDILSQKDFESFFWSLEKGPHDLIPNGVRGDFFSLTAPNG